MSDAFLLHVRQDAEALCGPAAELSSEAVFDPGDGSDPVPLSVVFQATYLAVDPGTGAVVSSTRPRVALPAHLCPAWTSASRLTVRGQAWRIVDQEPGPALVRLYLQEAN